jgi:hypothetical protein
VERHCLKKGSGKRVRHLKMAGFRFLTKERLGVYYPILMMCRRLRKKIPAREAQMGMYFRQARCRC